MVQMTGVIVLAIGLPLLFSSIDRGEVLDNRVMVVGWSSCASRSSCSAASGAGRALLQAPASTYAVFAVERRRSAACRDPAPHGRRRAGGGRRAVRRRGAGPGRRRASWALGRSSDPPRGIRTHLAERFALLGRSSPWARPSSERWRSANEITVVQGVDGGCRRHRRSRHRRRSRCGGRTSSCRTRPYSRHDGRRPSPGRPRVPLRGDRRRRGGPPRHRLRLRPRVRCRRSTTVVASIAVPVIAVFMIVRYLGCRRGWCRRRRVTACWCSRRPPCSR